MHRVPQHRQSRCRRGGGELDGRGRDCKGDVRRSVRQAEGRRIAPARNGHVRRQSDAAGDGVHGDRALSVPTCPHHEREPRRRSRSGGRRRGVQRRRPRGGLEGRASVCLARHRGHQDADPLPACDGRGPVSGGRCRGRHRREPRAGERRGRARRGRLRAASVHGRRGEGARGCGAARPLGPRHQRVLHLEARDGRRAGGDRRGGRRRHAPVLPAAPHPERDRAARRARTGRTDRAGDSLVGDAGAARPALRPAARARHPRVEDQGHRSGRGRRLRLEAERLRRRGARRRRREATRPSGEVDRGACRELRRDDPRPRRPP